MNTNQHAINLHLRAKRLLSERMKHEDDLFSRYVRECVRCGALVHGRGKTDGGRRGPATHYTVCVDCGGDNH
jgi:hypothetical protein